MTLPPLPQDPASIRGRTHAACASVDRSTPTQYDPIASSWKPDEAQDDPAGRELAWLTGRREVAS